jgi:hypothetical protein
VGVAARVIAALGLAACAGPTQKAAHRDDAGDAPVAAANDAAAPVVSSGAQGTASATTGSIDVKVDWPAAPAQVRASAGRTACGTPRRPAAVIHALHGVADVVVALDGSGAAADSAPATSLIVRDCRVEPRVAVVRAGSLVVASGDEHRHQLELVRAGDPASLGDPVADAVLARAALPVIGHEVAFPVADPAVLRVAVGDGGDPGWVVVAPQGRVAVTDETGAARWDAVPPGTYRARAWLPSAGARARGDVTVKAGASAELRLTLDASPP